MSVGNIQWEKWENPLQPDSDVDDEDEREVGHGRQLVLVGPNGTLPFQERSQVSKYYNFWVGHTDFRITESDYGLIKNVNGVESLNAPTRHRFRVAIGRAFDEVDVKMNIDRLFREPEPQVVRSLVDILSESLSVKFPYWAVKKDGGGRLSTVSSDTREEFESKLSNSKGEVVKSWA